MNLQLSPLSVYISHFTVNMYFQFQLYIFTNGWDTINCQFLHDNDNTKAIVKPPVFSENSRAKMLLVIDQSPYLPTVL